MRVASAIVIAVLLGFAGIEGLNAQNAPVKLTGKVVDESGAVMPSTDVKVFRGRNNTPVVSGKTDGAGQFDLPVAPGEYRLEVSAPDFETSRQTIRVAAGMKPLNIELKLPSVVVELEVSTTDSTVTADPAASVNGIVMTPQELAELPDNAADLRALLNQLASSLPGALDIDTDQAEIMIDGLAGGELPPKEQIASLRIVEDMSAEGGRRIEIVTRAGSGPWRGSMNLGFRDSALDARQPLTDRPKPNTQTRTYSSTFNGPIIQNRLGGSFVIRSDAQQNGVVSRAIAPTGSFAGITVSPTVTRGFSVQNMKWDIVPGKHSLTTSASITTTRQENSGVGGFNLPERANNQKERSWNFQVSQNSTVGKVVNIWRFQVNRSTNETRPAAISDPVVAGLVAVNVQDAFNGGASPNQTRSRNTGFILTEQLQTTVGRWALRANVQLERRNPVNESTNNYAGTYTFSSIHDYCVASGFYGDACQETFDIWTAAQDAGTVPVYTVAGAFGSTTERAITGVPTQFTQTVGDPRLEQRITTLQSELRGEWRRSQKFSLLATLRHRTENYLKRLGNFSPTIQTRYLIAPRTTVTVSGGLNVTTFNGGTYADILRASAGALQSNIVIMNPTYVAGQAPFDGSYVITPQTVTLRKLSPDYQDPYTIQAQVQLARQLTRNITASVTYSASRGLHQARYRNINAPYPGGPLPEELLARLNATPNLSCDNVCTQATREAARAEVNGMRPDPTLGNILQYESSRMTAQKQVSFGMRLNNVNLFDQVRLSVNPNLNLRWAKDSPSQPVNQWDPMAEWGRSSSDQRVQFRTPINVNWFPLRSWKWQFTTNFQLNVNSGSPYNITTGRDDNGDTVNNDRPAGVQRNSGTGPSNYQVDLTFSKRFLLFAPPRPREFFAFGEPQRGGGGGGFGGGGGGGNDGFGGGNRGGGGGGGNRNGNGNTSSRHSVTLQVQVFNLFNNTQLNAPASVVTSRFFGTSTTARAGRRIQVGLQMNLF
jgi:uncharacterized membrane protein YgcG